MLLSGIPGARTAIPDRTGENFLFLRTDISAYAPQWLLVPALFVAATIAITILYLICYFSKKLKRKKKNDAEQIIREVLKARD